MGFLGIYLNVIDFNDRYAYIIAFELDETKIMFFMNFDAFFYETYMIFSYLNLLKIIVN